MTYIYGLIPNRGECKQNLHSCETAMEFIHYLAGVIGTAPSDKELLLKALYDCADCLYSLKLEEAESDEELQTFDTLISCIEAFQEGPQNLFYLAMGNAQLRKGQYLTKRYRNGEKEYELALQYFGEVKSGKSADGKELILAAVNCGKCQREQGKADRAVLTKAIDQFSEVQELVRERRDDASDPFYRNLFFEANNNIGICYLNQSSYEKAEKEFLETIADSRKLSHIQDASLQNELLLIERQDYEGLRRAVEEGGAECPHAENTYLLQALVNLGIVKRKLTDYKNAISIFQFVLQRLDARNVDALNNSGVCWRKLGKMDEALECFKLVLHETKHRNQFAKMNRLKCRIKLKKFAMVESTLQKMYEKNKRNMEVLLLLGLYYRDNSDNIKANEIFHQICGPNMELKSGSPALKAYYNIGNCYMKNDRYNAAKKVFEEILQNVEGDVLSTLNLGWCLQNLGDYRGAIVYYEKLRGIKTLRSHTRSKDLNNLGKCYYHLNRISDAISCFEDVLKDEPSNSQALCNIGDCLRHLKEYGQAILKYEDSLQISPFDEYTNSNYVICLVEALESRNWKDEELPKKIENCLRQHSVQNYSLGACLAFLRYIQTVQDGGEREELYRTYSFLLPSSREEEYPSFYQLLRRKSFRVIPDADRGKIIGELFQIYLAIALIKNVCRITASSTDEEVPYTHYTRLNTLKILLSQEKDPPPRLRLWNTVYMNDPSEGETFIEMLKSVGQEMAPGELNQLLELYYPHLGQRPGKLIPSSSNVYMTSLSEKLDSIQMWVPYADGGSGCGITFERDFFDIKCSVPEDVNPQYSVSDYPLYRIQYVDQDRLFGDGNEQLTRIQTHMRSILEHIAILEKHLAALEEEAGKDFARSKEGVRVFVGNILNEIRFLFKNVEYEDEAELRVVRCSDTPKIEEKSSAIPRLYIEVEKDISIKEVKLGPKVKEVYEIVPWALATKKVREVTKSARNLR